MNAKPILRRRLMVCKKTEWHEIAPNRVIRSPFKTIQIKIEHNHSVILSPYIANRIQNNKRLRKNATNKLSASHPLQGNELNTKAQNVISNYN